MTDNINKKILVVFFIVFLVFGLIGVMFVNGSKTNGGSITTEIINYFNIAKADNYSNVYYFDSYSGDIRMFLSNSKFISNNYKESNLNGFVQKDIFRTPKYELNLDFNLLEEKEILQSEQGISQDYILQRVLIHELSHIVYLEVLEDENYQERLLNDFGLRVEKNIRGKTTIKNPEYWERFPEYELSALKNSYDQNHVRFMNIIRSREYPDYLWDDEVFVRILAVCLEENKISDVKGFQVRNNSFCNKFAVENYRELFNKIYFDVYDGYFNSKDVITISSDTILKQDLWITIYKIQLDRTYRDWILIAHVFQILIGVFVLYKIGSFMLKKR